MNCPNCGGTVPSGTNRCVKCGSHVEQPAAQPAAGQPAAAQAQPQAPVGPAVKSKMAAGLLGIFLGGLGIHRFYLGYTGIGVAMLASTLAGWVLAFFCIGIFIVIGVAIWGLVEGIMILTGSIDRDSQGRPLKE